MIPLDHICFEKSSSTFGQEHDALVKSTMNIFQILWPSQKTQTLNIHIVMVLAEIAGNQ